MKVFEVIADAGRPDLGAPFIKDLLVRLTKPPLSAAVQKANRAAAPALIQKYSSVSNRK